MRKRTSSRVIGVFAWGGLAAIAGGPGDCAAQLRGDPDQKRLSLSTAIEEARRSPFHPGRGGEANELRLSETAIGSAFWNHPQESGSQAEASFGGPAIGLTLVLAEASHLVGAYLLLGCAYGYVPAGCVLGPALALPVVALPAVASGVGVGDALIASTVGLAGGFVAFWAGMAVTESLHNANPFASALVSGLVHASITTVMLRRS